MIWSSAGSGIGAEAYAGDMSHPLAPAAWRRILDETTHPGKLATVTRDGSPTIVPVWFVRDGDDLVFNTGGATAKARHFQRDPRAALCVDQVTFPYGYILVRGPVTWQEAAPDLREWATRIAERYVPEGRAEEYGTRNGVPGEWLCRLRIERVVAVGDIAA
jgi:PPOX class probable F420-dependent enzyme